MIDLALTWQIDHITQSSLQYFSFLNTYLCILFWLLWVFVAAHWHSLGAVSGATLWLWCVGFPLQRLLLLQSTGSRARGLSSCGAQAWLL